MTERLGVLPRNPEHPQLFLLHRVLSRVVASKTLPLTSTALLDFFFLSVSLAATLLSRHCSETQPLCQCPMNAAVRRRRPRRGTLLLLLLLLFLALVLLGRDVAAANDSSSSSSSSSTSGSGANSSGSSSNGSSSIGNGSGRVSTSSGGSRSVASGGGGSASSGGGSRSSIGGATAARATTASSYEAVAVSGNAVVDLLTKPRRDQGRDVGRALALATSGRLRLNGASAADFLALRTVFVAYLQIFDRRLIHAC